MEISNGDWNGAVDIYVYGFAHVSCIYQIMCSIYIQINIWYIVYNIANHIGGNEWRLEIGDSREEEARTKQSIVSTGTIMY